MTDDNALPVRDGAAARWKAILVCIVIFALFMGLEEAVAVYASPFMSVVPMPTGAPALWWKIDRELTLSGTADLIGAILPVWLYLLITGRKLRSLGFDRAGTAPAWIVVVAAQALLLYSDVKMGPLGRVRFGFDAYVVYSSAFIGLSAAFAEETLFRGFFMEELRRGGFNTAWQVVISMVLFGLAHYSWVSGPYGWTVPVFTGLVGGFWSLVYAFGGRSLWPVLAAHVVNDAILIPAVYYFMLSQAAPS